MSILSFNGFVGIATIVGALAAVAALFRIRSLKIKTANLDKLNPSLEVLPNFKEVWNKVTAILQEELAVSTEVKIRNIGLDLEKMLPGIKEIIEEYFNQDSTLVFSYKGLIINPKSPIIEPLINEHSNIRDEYVTASLRRLKDYQEDYKEKDNIHLDVRSYDLPPTIHGLMINKKHLFLGFTEFKNKKLFGSECPYIYLEFDRKVVATSHYFAVFIDWFNYYWENGK